MAKKKAAQEMLEFAQELAPSMTDWYSFHNALFGINGKFKKLFATSKEREEFTQTDEYRQIQKMLDDLESNPAEVVKFQVRIPKSLHDQLKAEQDERSIKYLNDLIVMKLSVPVESLA